MLIGSWKVKAARGAGVSGAGTVARHAAGGGPVGSASGSGAISR
jgi:hypothetical protein